MTVPETLNTSFTKGDEPADATPPPDENVGYGLANFVVAAMRSFITTLGAV